MVEARNNGLSFCELNELESRVAIDQIMFRGAAIVGCSLPQTEMFAKFIAEEISDFILKFGYGELTEAEFLLAMQINAFGMIKNSLGNDIESVQFSGNNINVSFLAKVLSNYFVIRTGLETKIKNQLEGF